MNHALFESKIKKNYQRKEISFAFRFFSVGLRLHWETRNLIKKKEF